MLITDQKERLDIPHEPGEWLDIRPLTWRELDRARSAQTAIAMDNAGKLPLEIFQDARKEERKIPVENQYDRAVVIKAGIVGWSYTTGFSAEGTDKLDARTAEWAFKAILERSTIPSAEGEGSDGTSEPSTTATRDGPQS